MKLLKKSILIVVLILSSMTIAQTRRSANKMFNRLAYVDSAKAYTDIYQRGDDSYLVISRIADSYYFNTDMRNAEKWYKILGEKYPKKMTDDHKFRYAQSLKGNEKYEQADEQIKTIAGVSNNYLATQLLKNPEYYKKYKYHKYDVYNFSNLDINTKLSDFGAAVFKEELYFASAKPGVYKELYQWNEQPFLNLYRGKIKNINKNTNKEELTVKTSKLVDSVRTKYHESNAIFTKDGKTMYFTRDNYNKGIKRTSRDRRVRLKLYKRNFVEGKWGEIEELPFNNDEYSVGHPALSPDEKTLYFTSDMPGGFGATDIYKVAVKDNGTKYGKPVNLGAEINTKAREMFPFVSKDNTFYFSSDGHLGLGGLDVFETPITDGKFGKIENLQEPFNSNLDDFCFYIDLENRRGFVSSNRADGKGDDDIYSFVLKRPKRRLDYDCKKTVSGIVTNLKTGEILPNATVRIHDGERQLVKETMSDDKGAFSFKINCLSEQYKLKGEKESFKEDLEEVVTANLKDGDVIKLELEPIVVKPAVEELVIHPIYFNFDKSGIRGGDSRPELDEIIRIMNMRPNLVIGIESHTDSRATHRYNIALSNRRARSTRKYLISKGIPASRIAFTKGYGETQLLNGCDDNTKCTEEEHQLNRRSYFVIVSGGEGVRVDNTPPKIIDRKPGY